MEHNSKKKGQVDRMIEYGDMVNLHNLPLKKQSKERAKCKSKYSYIEQIMKAVVKSNIVK